MKEIEYSLDGITKGIVALKPGTDEILKLGNYKELSLFTNLRVLEAAIERKDTPFEYELGFSIDGKIIHMNKVLKPENSYYEYFSGENEISYIYPEINSEKMIICGYLTFGESPKVRTVDKEFGKVFSKNIYHAVSKALCYNQRKGLFKSGKTIPGAAIITDEKILTRSVYKSTLVLRIVTPYALFQINNFRKDCDLRALPFIKEYDNYKNLYFFFSRDENEFKVDGPYIHNSYEIIDEILNYLHKVFPELNANVEMIKFGRSIDLRK